MKYLSLLLIVLLIGTGCHRSYKEHGSRHIVIFDQEHLNFDPEAHGGRPDLHTDDVIRIMDGRILLRKLNLPAYQRDVKATLRITFTSAGDTWDKSGSCFVIPANQAHNILAIHNSEVEFPIPNTDEVEDFKGIVAGDNFLPTVELMRFMTPFGAISERTKNRKPVYIPKWEPVVVWEQDITDRLSQLEGDFWIGIWADTWTKEGYIFSAELILDESPFPCAARTKTEVLPLLNTVYYIGGQSHVDIFARKDINVNANIPANAKNVRLFYTTTGHGGHSGGDEFVPKENVIYLNNEKIYSFIPWRDDCASFRRFNPSSGVWLRQDSALYLDRTTRSYQVKVIEERLASSDLSRSNWCPGSVVEPEQITLDNLKPGNHTFTFSIPEAQEADGHLLNHWLVAAWLVWDK
ncbi:peptide-N-glycosidase F-related protein [Alkaliflexus imshenetskii]|uniref:peptide-N-glycosidase F-related protein n=1 Tax=Alkaliflexus imshenetskii TaxID=286730 RepID=UPI000479A5EE|nr:PNGase F N-terminal domain-containing protein [Alkaliflexus imshenetskii]